MSIQDRIDDTRDLVQALMPIVRPALLGGEIDVPVFRDRRDFPLAAPPRDRRRAQA